MKTDILATIDAVLAENRDVKRQRMFSKVMDLLDNPTQLPMKTAHLLDLSRFDELPGEAAKVDLYATDCWNAFRRLNELPEKPSTQCDRWYCRGDRVPGRLFCDDCLVEGEEETTTGWEHRTDAATLK